LGLDIRLPIGLLFTIFGVLLTIFGLVSNPALYAEHSLGINVNFGWGIVLFFFGLIMLFLGARAMKHPKPASASATPESTQPPRGH
jgi:amino acid transporter